MAGNAARRIGGGDRRAERVVFGRERWLRGAYEAHVVIERVVRNGGFCGRNFRSNHLVAVVVASLWAFVAGLVVSISATASDLGVISTVSLLVYAAQPLSARQTAISGLLALAGGLLQTGLSIAMWPARRYEPERRALAGYYQQLHRTQTILRGLRQR
jgi:hypothetical protein